MQSHMSLKTQAELTQKKYEKKQKDFENIKQGKNILSIFSSGSNEAKMKKRKKKLEFLEFEIKAIEIIENINAVRLMNLELPLFKQNKIQSLVSVLKTFGESIQLELDKYKNQSRMLEQALNSNND